MADAKIVTEGDASGAINEAIKLRKQMQKLIAKNKELGEESKKQTKATKSGLSSIVTRYAGAAAGVALLTKGITASINETLRLQEVTDRLGRTTGDQRTATMTQLMLKKTSAEAGQIDTKISKMAAASGETTNVASAAVEAMSSGGMSTDMILETDVGLAIMMGMKALASKDIPGDTKAFIGFLRNSGLGISMEGAQKAFEFASKAKQTGKFEIGDLVHLGKKISVAIQAGIPFNQIMATFIAMLDKSSPEEAATGLRTLVARSLTGFDTKAGKKALSSLGIKKSELFTEGKLDLVKFEKEFKEASKEKPKKFPTAIKSLFEMEGMAHIMNLVSSDLFEQTLGFGGQSDFMNIAKFNTMSKTKGQRGRAMTALEERQSLATGEGMSHNEGVRLQNINLDQLQREGAVTVGEKWIKQFQTWLSGNTRSENLRIENANEAGGAERVYQSVTDRLLLQRENEFLRETENPDALKKVEEAIDRDKKKAAEAETSNKLMKDGYGNRERKDPKGVEEQ